MLQADQNACPTDFFLFSHFHWCFGYGNTETVYYFLIILFPDQVLMASSSKRSRTPPPEGFQYVEMVGWEASNKRSNKKPVNGHTGIYAYHCDDCWCSIGGWPCMRDGYIWSCCGSSERYSQCYKSKPQKKEQKKEDRQIRKPWRP